MDCYLALRGVKTLAVRMRAHSDGARRIAEWLAEPPEGRARVLPGPADASRSRRRRAADGGLRRHRLVHGRLGATRRSAWPARTKLFFLAESLGGVESLIEVPGPMTHASVAGSPLEVPPELIRLSVGLEHPDDLIADLEAALA